MNLVNITYTLVCHKVLGGTRDKNLTECITIQQRGSDNQVKEMMYGGCFTATSILKTNLISKLGTFCISLNVECTLSNCREFPQFIAVIF